jgi:transcriptional regulator with XRE-family HTH domain
MLRSPIAHPLRKGARELRALRAKLRLTAKEVALGTGLSISQVEHLELGYTQISPTELKCLKTLYKETKL